MREFKALIVITILAVLIGCGTADKQEPSKTQNETTATASADQAEVDKVKAAMTELIDRVVEGDVMVLYENEFGYYTDENSLSDYMKENRVINYNYDTLRGITYDSVFVTADTAHVYAKVHYESVTGDDISRDYSFWMYKYNGKWIKPYMSNINYHLEELEQRRIYDSAAAAEETERLGH